MVFFKGRGFLFGGFMDEERKEIASVPYIVYESAQTRMERTVKRLLIALIIAVFLVFASNAVWLYAWMQYDYISDETQTTTTVETGTVDINAENGNANYIGNNGDIINGTDKSQENKNDDHNENQNPEKNP